MDTSKDSYLQSLMLRTQEGDADSYKMLLDEVYKELKPFVLRRYPSIADDVLQEIVLTLHRFRHTYNPERPFLPWLFAIAKHRLEDEKRNIWRQQRKIVALKESQDLEDPVFTSDISERLTEALKNLPQRQREIVSLLKLEGYSVKEIAKTLSLSTSAVKVAAHRAYSSLKKSLLQSELSEE